MTRRRIPGRYRACLLAILCLASMLAGGSPPAWAQPSAPCYERTFRYPSPVLPLIETMAEVQWRERTRSAPEREPGEEGESLNPSLGLSGADLQLLPGAQQSEIVVPASGAFPLRTPELLPPFAPLLASPLADRKFDGLGYTGAVPPDSALAAGPAHLVCSANPFIQVRTLTGTVLSTVSFASFFPTDPTKAGTDPRLVFDTATGRFIFTAIGLKTSSPRASTCMLAISATSDPTGVWYKYVLDVGRGGTPPTEYVDFPSLGYDGAAIYITFNVFSFGQNQFRGNRLLILDKSQALSGQALTNARIVDNLALPSPPFAPGQPNGILKPVEAASPLSPYVLIATAGLVGLSMYQITDPLGTSGGPFIQASFMDITDFEIAGSAPQAGSAIPLSVLSPGLEKAVYRDGVLWVCHTVSSTGARGGKAQVNLYKLSPAAGGFLLDMKSIVDSSRSYYYSTIMPDGFGDAILAFEGSDATTFASIYNARFNGATGQMDTPTLVEPGLSPFVVVDSGGRNRWGDYLDASPDLVTGTHIWVQGMIAIASELWQMKIARIPASPPAPPGSLTVTPVSVSRVDLAWTDNSIEETGFKIERKAGDADFVLLAIVGENVTRYSDTSVSAGTSYTYRVRSFNGAGDSLPTVEAGVTTPDRSVSIMSLLLAPNPVSGGSPVVGIVMLDGPAPNLVTVTLTSSNAAVASPAVASLLFPPGTVSAPFLMTTVPVSSPTSLTVTAVANGSSKSTTLNVLP